MNWSLIWPSRWFRVKNAPALRKPSPARLLIEQLEERVVLTTAPTAVYQQWAQQVIHVDDASLNAVTLPVGPTAQNTIPQNASFGSMIGLPAVFSDTNYRGDGYSVAIIDTGVDYNNPNLGSGFGPGHRVIAGWDFVNNDANPMDDNGHGTHVAGIIGSSNGTYSGIAPDVNLIALKVLDATGSGTFQNVQNALDWVVAHRSQYNIVAVNMSLGSGNYSVNPYTFLDTDLSSLKTNGVFVSVAAGNSFYSLNSVPGLDYPAIDSNVVSVGAVYDGNFGSMAWASGARDYVTAPDLIASFSQRSSALSILAPGAMITSTYLNDAFQAMAGTSMAAPVIAGAAVIIHQAMDSLHLTANESTILALMQRTGVSIVDNATADANVKPTGLTFKRIDLAAALDALGTPPTTPTPPPVNVAPVLQPIADQTVAPGASRTLTLAATDPNGDAVTFTVTVIGVSTSQAYQLKTSLGLTYAGSYFQNIWGKNEKWLTSKTGIWYCILPNGQLRRWTGSMATTLQPANLVTTLSTSIYADPSLILNAQPAVGPTVSVVGKILTIKAPAGVTGSYQIQVTASDGKLTSSKTFTLTVAANSPPQIATISDVTMYTNRAQTFTISATDPQNKAVTLSAKVVGSLASLPATLVMAGNKLTINTSPDFIGGFDVQVTASDGSLTSTSMFHVTVNASPIAYRFSGDFNGDGIQDTAFFNQDGSWWISLNKADGTFTNQNWANWSTSSAWATVSVGKFNSDNKTDIAGVSTGGAVWVATSTGTGFAMQLWTQWAPASSYKSLLFGDFTGDGKTDLLGFTTGGAIWVAASTGTTFTTTLWAQWSASSYWTTISAIDVDGDGKVDLIGKNTNGKWYVAKSTGTTFVTQLWTGTNPPA
jgi:subtilisin family serine protease